MKSGESVQLEGPELEGAQHALREAQKHLEGLAQTVLEKLGKGKMELGPAGIAEIRVHPKNVRIILVDADGNCVGVYRDPPGVCENC